MAKIEIKDGFTNKSWRDGNKFVQQKVKNAFNHKIDYESLKDLDFVPKLISNNEDEIAWQWIEGQHLPINDNNLKQVAQIFKQLHNSKKVFPPSNHAARVKDYLKNIKNKNVVLPIKNEYYKKLNLILKNMKKDCPLHNDLWFRNILQDQEQKIYIVDWEYATMGDKHFDLAYFIISSQLNDEQETIFLNEYDDYDYEHVLQHKFFVVYLIILWLNDQPTMPFPDTPYYKMLDDIVDTLAKYKEKWALERQNKKHE